MNGAGIKYTLYIFVCTIIIILCYDIYIYNNILSYNNHIFIIMQKFKKNLPTLEPYISLKYKTLF